MNYYPVLIPTLNRYEHFRRCVESLSRCTHSKETELVIGLDYPPSEKYREGYEKIKAYIPQITGFKKVTCIKREYNYGAVNNSIDLTNRYFEIYDAIIYSEDDNEFAPCFLDYMNKALREFKKDTKVSSVSGYSFPRYKGYENYDSYFTHVSSAWGIGIWRNKEELLKEQLQKQDIINRLLSWKNFWKCYWHYPYVIIHLMNMIRRNEIWGDVCRAFVNVINSMYEIRPSATLVRNWGDDGSGLHCGTKCENSKQALCNDTIRNIEKTASIKYIKTCYYQKTDFFSQNIIITVAKLILLPLKYFIFKNSTVWK